MEKIIPEMILVGEVLSYRGSRLTEILFTSKYLLRHNKKGLTLFDEENGY